jgi:hypothetical protein
MIPRVCIRLMAEENTYELTTLILCCSCGQFALFDIAPG